MSPAKKACFNVEYIVKAELLTKIEVNQVIPLQKSQIIKLEQPMNQVPDQNLTLVFKNKIGGFLGLGSSEYKAKAIFS